MNVYAKLFFVLLCMSPFLVLAHPGNTASDGGHYCWTNCASWGQVYGQRHFHGGSSYSAPSTYSSYSSFSTPSCPLHSYASGSSCKCSYGYVASGDTCVSADNLCHEQLGIMSSYDSLSDKCKCSYGYAIGTFGRCEYQSKYQSSNFDYSGLFEEDSLTCPANSKESKTGDGCTCNVGYKTDTKGNKCVKISKKENNKLCQADFGKNSIWNGKYDKEEKTPYCVCKKKYKWNSGETSCIKS